MACERRLGPLLCSRPRAVREAPLSAALEPPPAEEAAPRPVSDADLSTPGPASAPSCGARSATRPGTSGSSRCDARARSRRRRSSSRRRTTIRAVGRRRASRGCCRPAPTPCSAPASQRASSSRPAAAHPEPRAGARAAGIARRPRGASTRASRSTSSSSATPTASPTPPRWRSPRCPASPTTRCSSAAPPGLGKTHLLHSIANYVTDARRRAARPLHDGRGVHRPLRRRAAHGGAIEAFKAAYRDVDVLLVDDVQFLAEQGPTEQEFFHTFNALHGAGAQLVLTSDRLPRDLDALEDRLRERFEAGLVDRRPPARRRHAADDPAQARAAGRHRRRRPRRRSS